MKSYSILLVCLLLAFSSFAQKTFKDELRISDSLFNAPSEPYRFVFKGDSSITKIISIRNDSLYMSISYAGGCSTVETKLVTDGVLQKDAAGNRYYILKLYVNDEDVCKSTIIRTLAFKLSDFKKPNEVVYFKFSGYDALIEYR